MFRGKALGFRVLGSRLTVHGEGKRLRRAEPADVRGVEAGDRAVIQWLCALKRSEGSCPRVQSTGKGSGLRVQEAGTGVRREPADVRGVEAGDGSGRKLLRAVKRSEGS